MQTFLIKFLQMQQKIKETKSFSFEIKAMSEEDNNFVFEGYASTFGNVDLGEDVIAAGAFAKTLIETPNVPILWQHEMDEPIGISITLREDAKGLFVQAKLPKDDTQVSGKVIPQMRIGSVREMSIGYFAINCEYQDEIRIIKEIELFEISLVTKAMNPKALVTGFKSLESLSDVEKSLKERGFSNTEAKTLISKIKEFSNQRDAEEIKALRDAEQKAKLLAGISDLTNFIKSKKQ